jgi:deoxyribodipyrimidine photolyase
MKAKNDAGKIIVSSSSSSVSHHTIGIVICKETLKHWKQNKTHIPMHIYTSTHHMKNIGIPMHIYTSTHSHNTIGRTLAHTQHIHIRVSACWQVFIMHTANTPSHTHVIQHTKKIQRHRHILTHTHRKTTHCDKKSMSHQDDGLYKLAHSFSSCYHML